MAVSRDSQLLAFAQLMRLPNVFTSFADICMAGAATGAILGSPGTFLLALMASGCLYLAGMVFNDVFDRAEDAKARPFRPIPSGRVSVRTAWLLGAILILGGVLFAWVASQESVNPKLDWIHRHESLSVALLLILAILGYDAILKRTPAGPLGMGFCRFLNVLLGCSIAPTALPPLLVYHLAGTVGLYIVGVTWFARTEESTSQRTHLLAACGVMLAAAGLALAVPTHLPAGSSPWYFPFLLVIAGFWVGTPVARAVRRPEPKLVQAAVKRCIFGLVALDAVLAVAFVGWPGLAILLLLLPAGWLGKWVYST